MNDDLDFLRPINMIKLNSNVIIGLQYIYLIYSVNDVLFEI